MMAWALVVALGATACAATRFAEGSLEVAWSDDGLLSVEVALDVRPPSGAALMWVVTVNALRFAQGIHVWQLHLSPTHQSVVVVPNDFLVTQRFSFEQLGIRVGAHEPGLRMQLSIPRSRAITDLVMPGDTLAVHALWLQQAPLATVPVPEPVARTPYVPTQTVYVRGTAIQHSFSLVDQATGSSVVAGSATIGLLRVDDGKADEIVRYIYREPDTSTGVVTYEFDTTKLPLGRYALVVWVQPFDVTVRHEFEIVESAP